MIKTIPMGEKDISAMSALALAHIGDSVFELMVRTRLCLSGCTVNGKLHKKTVELVCAAAQAKLVDRLLPLLTEEETAYYRRGRNTRVHGVPKNVTAVEYSKATGLEALFGTLYLKGEMQRLQELFDTAMEENYAL